MDRPGLTSTPAATAGAHRLEEEEARLAVNTTEAPTPYHAPTRPGGNLRMPHNHQGNPSQGYHDTESTPLADCWRWGLTKPGTASASDSASDRRACSLPGQSGGLASRKDLPRH
jgi:hypothetical protein